MREKTTQTRDEQPPANKEEAPEETILDDTLHLHFQPLDREKINFYITAQPAAVYLGGHSKVIYPPIQTEPKMWGSSCRIQWAKYFTLYWKSTALLFPLLFLFYNFKWCILIKFSSLQTPSRSSPPPYPTSCSLPPSPTHSQTKNRNENKKKINTKPITHAQKCPSETKSPQKPNMKFILC